MADSQSSDGLFRCLSVCVNAQNGEPTPIQCLDDRGCCDPDGACTDDGSCISPPGGGSGGSDPSADGGGCDVDRDDDGLVNAFDANPDQSCSADQDGDGVRDSCDANDTSSDDGCFGCGLLPRSSSTTLAYLVIAIVAWRRRAPRRRR